MASEPLIQVEVMFASVARTVQSVALKLAPGSTVEQALTSSKLLSGLTAGEVKLLEVGIWGHKTALAYVLRDRDRVELYRPLKVDPKVARRERFTQQGAKTAGLFAKRRKGAKSGY